jgi:hypothetical protein
MEIEELPKSKFNQVIEENPACMLCFDNIIPETGAVVDVACRHPLVRDKTKKCGAGYHAECFEKMRRVTTDFHCLGCFVGRGSSTTQFRLLYRLRNPLTPAEAAENEAYDARIAMAEDKGEEPDNDGKRQKRGGTYKKNRKRTIKK